MKSVVVPVSGGELSGGGPGVWRPRVARALLVALVVFLALPSSGCYTRRMKRVEVSVDTLRMQVTDLAASQDRAYRELLASHEEQRNLLHSLRAGTNVASQDLIDRIEALSAKLDDTADRLYRLSRRQVAMPPPAGDDSTVARDSNPPPGVDAQTMYEQAARDFTQGRFELALVEFRSLLAAYPEDELADNSLYGVGEAFYALASYDSSVVAYQQVENIYPRGDKVPAALYKMGMAFQKLGRTKDARETFERLREAYPRSGEATLAEERLKELER